MNSSSWAQKSPKGQSSTTADDAILSGAVTQANSTGGPQSSAFTINATSITQGLYSINSSLNPTMPVSGPTLQLFFVTTVPLAIATVLLPLFILPVFTYFAKKASFPNFRNSVLWGWIFITFILNLIVVIGSAKIPNIFPIFYLAVFCLMSVSFGIQFIGAIWWFCKVPSSKSKFRHSLWRHKWLIVFWVAWVVLYYVGQCYPGESLAESLIYLSVGSLLPYGGILVFQVVCYATGRSGRRKRASYKLV
jgi:hypothetical protein